MISLNKKKLLTTLSILSSFSLCAANCAENEERFQAPQMPTCSGYNAPAAINIGKPGDYDVFINTSFIYWQPLIDNLQIGMAAQQTLEGLLTEAIVQYIFLDYDYKPGFKLAVGMNFPHDNWSGYLEYTRLHGAHTGSFHSSEEYPIILATQGNLFQLYHFGQVFTSAFSKYTCNLDFLDAMLERSCYVGEKLIFRPSFGIRGAWIHQKLHTIYNSDVQDLTIYDETFGLISLIQPNGQLVYKEDVPCWGVGPRTGVKMDWQFIKEFRFIGNTFIDLLYTHYHMSGSSIATTREAQGALVAGQVIPLSGSNIDVNAVRAHVSLETGFGWGTYFAKNKSHFDFALTYDFEVFFNQNMFPTHIDSNVNAAVLIEKGNVYVQGLNASARFDF